MNKTVLALMGATLILSACAKNNGSSGNILVAQRATVVEIPEDFLECSVPDLSAYAIDALTDADVSDIILAYNRENTKCSLNMQAIRNIIERSKDIVNDVNTEK